MTKPNPPAETEASEELAVARKLDSVDDQRRNSKTPYWGGDVEMN